MMRLIGSFLSPPPHQLSRRQRRRWRRRNVSFLCSWPLPSHVFTAPTTRYLYLWRRCYYVLQVTEFHACISQARKRESYTHLIQLECIHRLELNEFENSALNSLFCIIVSILVLAYQTSIETKSRIWFSSISEHPSENDKHFSWLSTT